MIRFKSISIKNFLSYGNVPAVINLDCGGTVLITGEDHDNSEDGTGSNGVGKTAIINALTFCLYNKPISNISKDRLVNNINKKGLEVIVDFDIGKDKYRVRRVRKERAGASGNYVQIFKNNNDITLDSVARSDELIESIIGIPFELFIRIITFSANHTPFLDLPVRSPQYANQTDIIEELFDLKRVSEIADRLKNSIKENEQKLELLLVQVEQQEKEKQRHKEQLKIAKQRIKNWEKQTKEKIQSLEKELKNLRKIDVDKQEELFHQYTKLLQDKEKLESTLKEISYEIKLSEKELKKHKKELHHLKDDKCPYCKQKFPNADKKAVECEIAITEHEKIINENRTLVEELEKKIEKINKKLATLKKKLIVDDLSKIYSIKNDITAIEKQIVNLQNEKNPYIEPYEELKAVKLDRIDKRKINDLKKTVDHQKFLYKLLAKKDSFVRKALLNKNIPFLNKRLRYYLSSLGLPHNVEFTHEMTAKITQFGRELDFGNLSNGQQARVNLALSLAFRDVLQHIHGKVNLCILDEVLDQGLDVLGVQSAIRLLKRLARDEKSTVFIISHRDEITGTFDKKLIVRLKDGFSSVSFEQQN